NSPGTQRCRAANSHRAGRRQFMMAKLPSMTPREVIQVLQRAGFVFHHQRGSHAYYHHAGDRTQWVTVPIHPGTLKPGTLRSIIRQSGLTRQQFIALL
ncbi:MAG TPA: type II toxin-antitoxin system HicA family toxin, partial [Pirellulales bacterium]|nr:type II toxin-antitoxin system HicA family toxin [Pirellulales bacterium]